MTMMPPSAADAGVSGDTVHPFSLSVLTSRIVELSGWECSACVSLASTLILECQRKNREAAWIVPRTSPAASLFFPPDFAGAGIDCGRLPIVCSMSAVDGLGIAEKLMRSGAFGLVVMDLTGDRRLKNSSLGRIHALAKRHECLVLCLTRAEPGRPSLDPMVFLHVRVTAEPSGDGIRRVSALVMKDKTGPPGKRVEMLYEPPSGLC